MADLFDHAAEAARQEQAPLAERLRPRNLEEVVGQKKLVGADAPLRVLIEKDRLPSLIFWGPPGSGKTTLARVIAQHTQAKFVALSAVLSGVKDLREVVEQAKADFKFSRKKTIVFIDEIHRFNKAQQDALLPHLEAGTITLIGATTENPSFEVIGPLLSRARVFVLEGLTEEDLKALIRRAEEAMGAKLEAEAAALLLEFAAGDARRLLNTFEIAANLAAPDPNIDLKIVEQAAQHKTLLYDKGGEEHYNLISAFIKSMRNSDPDAAVYYLARMYEAGEDPLYLARRMVIFASEDVGLADPQALQVAIAAMQAYDFVGRPEGWIPLSQAAIYLALAPKNNSSYLAYAAAKAEIGHSGPLPTPLHVRNAPTKLMKELGYGKGYRYAHDDAKAKEEMDCLPEKLKGRKFFVPKE
ncbi:MAG TPA: replication-associated recombination protein A [bacterium]|nr:replication-associated recombination protein A [bacterium]